MAGFRRPTVGANTILFFLINLAINIEWTIPAWILLALHFVMGTPLWWFAAALTAWFFGVLVMYVLLGFVMSMDGGDSHKKRTPEEQAEHDRKIREISRSVHAKKEGQR